MDYPVWIIPGVSKGFIMGLVAVLHVFVAQFAVGGGIYLVFMEKRARAWNEPEVLAWLKRHTLFFLLLTMVFGGLSGVGIWFTMSLANPAATSALIHTFLWIWATEWVFFLLEIVALLVYHYSYPLVDAGRMSAQTHLRVGYVYAVAGYMSLVLINGVICFMLTPGLALETSSLWDAFFNPSTMPSLLFRTALCLMLAGMFGMFTASRIKSPAAKRLVIRMSSLWVLVPLIGLLAGSAWYYAALPPDRQAAVLRRTADIHPFLLAYSWVVPIIFALSVIAFARAARLRLPLAVLILASGLVLVGSFETMRETGRRPWIIPGYMYSSSARPQDAPLADKDGLAAVSPWLRLYDEENQDSADYAFTRGKLIFAQQCGTCHSVGGAGLDVLPRLEKLTAAGIFAQITGQGKSIEYMPPFFGNRADKEALTVYLGAVKSKTADRAPGGAYKVSDPGCIMTALPPRSEQNDEIPPFADDSEYVLVAFGLQGFYQSSDFSLPWTVDLPETRLEAQLIKRGPLPEIVSDNVTISWSLVPSEWTDGGSVSTPALRGNFTRAEGQGHFSADLAVRVKPEAKGSFNPYQLVEITATDGSGQVLAQSAAGLSVAPGFGCAHCHADPGFGILELHDKRNRTSLTAEAKGGARVTCTHCHMPIHVDEDGKYNSVFVMDFSSTIHAWHAQYLEGRDADACLSCHVGLGKSGADTDGQPQNLFLRDPHQDRGLSCVSCHGYMEDHSLALLRAEKIAGQALADKFMPRIKPRLVESAEEINPRLAWKQLPDCTTCHDFFEKPQPGASAFNKWTGGKDGEAEPFSRRRDYSEQVRCASCHGAPHAIYPAKNPVWPVRDNIPPLQYQQDARVLGGAGHCAACHTVTMDMPIHHPVIEGD